tara:strand:- start:745 stop:2013 length:1269 start_codon:yes stop_codon:yes gene_type:complete
MSILARLAGLMTGEDQVALDRLIEQRSAPTPSPTVFPEPTVDNISDLIIQSEGAATRAGEVSAPVIETPLPEDDTSPVDETIVETDDQGGPEFYVGQIQNIGGKNYQWNGSEWTLLPGQDDPPPDVVIPGSIEVPGAPVEEFDAKAFAELNYSWLSPQLMDTFLQEYNTNGGDSDEAIRSVRTTQAYRDEFPGIFREDGTTLRIETATPELDYIKMKEDYSNLLADYNLNPNYFEDQVTTLFENDVSPYVFEQRLSVAYNSLFNQFESVKQYYVENYPNTFTSVEDISDEAIFASFISEDVSKDIIDKRISVSQIGGAFKEQDFAIDATQAQRLISAGLTGTGAQQLAARAESQLPRLKQLAKRFTGREDIFGLSEFIESEVFGEGVSEQLRERLEAEQRTVFTREGGAARTQEGLTGLVEL